MLRNTQKTIALVDMDAFLASVEQALNPDLIGKPVIVGGLPGTRGVVICASYEARRLGIKFGLSLAEAHRRLPNAVFLKGDIRVYRDYWAEICDIFHSFTPLVEPVSMDEAYLDLTCSLSLFESIEILSHTVKDAIRERLNINCSVGIGTSKMFAKIACLMAKSKRDGVAVLKPEAEQNMLGELHVDKLPNIGWKTKALLAELGVYTVRQLRDVPQPVLIELFGKRGIEWYDYARGIDKRKVKTQAMPKSISRETTFNADSVDKKFLNGMLYYLLERVCLELRRLSLQTRRVAVKIRYVDYKFADCAATLSGYSDNEPDIFPTVEKLFSEIYTRKVGIRHLGITAVRLIPAMKQFGFFDHEKNKYSNLSRELDRIRRHFGYHAIFYGKTMPLSGKFREVVDGYELRTPSLSL
ncbi:MAG: DNA polymerase IV [candidate division Zixibacteria bacterium]|nr:DNA polymerase IV [candidate division Zixibacteria bacterium]